MRERIVLQFAHVDFLIPPKSTVPSIHSLSHKPGETIVSICSLLNKFFEKDQILRREYYKNTIDSTLPPKTIYAPHFVKIISEYTKNLFLVHLIDTRL